MYIATLLLTHSHRYTHTHTHTQTHRLQPLNLKDGVTLRRRLPLDGTEGHAKLEVRANLCLPEPEIEYSTDKKRLIMGTGDIQLSIDELNLCLEY